MKLRKDLVVGSPRYNEVSEKISKAKVGHRTVVSGKGKSATY